MRARARVVAEDDGHRGTRLTELRSEAPLVLRATPEALYLVGGAGGPLGGDDLNLEIEVGPGARLTIRTAAASVALPGPGPSRLRIRATVGAGGALCWLPEPLVAARGCDHHVEADVVLEDGATLVWRDEVVLGRHGEESGSVVTRSTVDHAGVALLRHELALGPCHPTSRSPAVTAGARACGSVLLVGPEWARTPTVLGPRAAAMPLAGPGVQVVVLADDALQLRHQLVAALESMSRVCAASGPGTNRPCSPSS